MSEIRKEQATVRSFRVTEEVMGRFKALQEEMQLTQDSALKMLVDAYEFEQAKNAIPDRETEISNFQAKANELVDAFLHSLQLNQDAESRIRSEVAMQMQAKDNTIADYQAALQKEKEKTADYYNVKEELQKAMFETTKLTVTLEKKDKALLETEENFHAQLSDKESIISMLTEKLQAASQKAEAYDSFISEKNALSEQVSALQEELKEQRRSSERQLETSISAAKAEKEQIIADLREKLQNAQLEAERLLRSVEKEYSSEIRKLEKENGMLREELAGLRGK